MGQSEKIDDENVSFETVRNAKRTFIPSIDGCSNLRAEILHLCNPARFMDPYDENKVNIANDIYAKARSLSIDTPDTHEVLISLRNWAVDDLAVQFSTERIYKRLTNYCDPKRYLRPYDHDKVMTANAFYARITANADNIIVLSEIENEAKNFIDSVRTNTTSNNSSPNNGNNDDVSVGLILCVVSLAFLALLLIGFAIH